jgi:hypothetical protein
MAAVDAAANSPIAPAADGVFLSVRVTPRARRRGVGAVDAQGALAVAVGSPPEDGKATEETVELLAAHFGLPKRAFALAQGAASRCKRFKIAGAPEALMATMGAKLR